MRFARVTVIALAWAGTAGGLDAKAVAAESTHFSPKIGIRLSPGLLQNSGKTKGSILLLAALDPVFLYFVGPQTAIGAAYLLDLDLSKGKLPVSGPELLGRYYFGGAGTRVRGDELDGSSEVQNQSRFYCGMGLAQRSYFLTSANTSLALNGSFLALNGMFGLDHPISTHMELTAEGNLGLLTFSSSDERIRFRGMLLKIGVNYTW